MTVTNIHSQQQQKSPSIRGRATFIFESFVLKREQNIRLFFIIHNLNMFVILYVYLSVHSLESLLFAYMAMAKYRLSVSSVGKRQRF